MCGKGLRSSSLVLFIMGLSLSSKEERGEGSGLGWRKGDFEGVGYGRRGWMGGYCLSHAKLFLITSWL